ncbi:hypothetical protein D3C81_1544830 [compost metagenome]
MGSGYGLGAGAAVDEELVPSLQGRHQPGHGRWLCGHAATHVVVDAAGVRDHFERGVQAFFQLIDGQLGVPGERSGGRIHGHVQDDDLAGAMGFAGEFGGVGCIGHDRRSHRAGQGQHAAIPGQVLPQVIDDQAQVGFVGRRSGGFCMSKTRQTTQQSDQQPQKHLNGRT